MKHSLLLAEEKEEVYVDDSNVNVIRYKSPSTFLQRSLALLKILNSTKSDLFISRSFYTTVITLLARKKVIYVLPAVYKNQNSPLNVANSSLIYKIIYKVNCFLEIIAIKQCHQIFVFSHSMRKQVEELGVDRELILCHPGVDSAVYNRPETAYKQALRVKYELPNNKKILLGLGRMVKIKGFQHTIESMQFLDDSFHLILVGDGSYKKELMALASKLNVENQVSFFAFTNVAHEFYKLADVFLMTSLYEPFGQVILEAVACGLKVVSFSNSLENVDTATDEIFNNYPQLNFQASSLSGQSLSETIKNMAERLDDDCSVEYNAFIKKYSWKQLFSDLCNKYR